MRISSTATPGQCIDRPIARAGVSIRIRSSRTLGGSVLEDVVADCEHEGLVGKPETSTYRQGAWKKVKVRREGVFELAGVARDREGLLMLVVDVCEGRTLRYAGVVGFGVTRGVLSSLYPVFEPLARTTSPVRFADCVWRSRGCGRS